MEHVVALFPLLGSQPVLQTIVGGCAAAFCLYMMFKANREKQALPPPAPGGITDIPQVFAQGPREAVDVLREMRDFLRRMTEDISRIAECVRITREEARKQTDLMEKLVQGAEVDRRVASERHHHP